MLEKILYALACVILPIAWGVMIYFISNRLEAVRVRRRPAPSTSDQAPLSPEVPPQLEYYI